LVLFYNRKIGFEIYRFAMMVVGVVVNAIVRKITATVVIVCVCAAKFNFCFFTHRTAIFYNIVPNARRQKIDG